MAGPLPIAHLNGQLLPLADARVSPLDRSFLFGDGIYEVIPVYAGKLFRLQDHLDRLRRSAAALGIRNPHDDQAWRTLLDALIVANGSGNQYVYLQISRGAEWGRNHAPPAGLQPTVFAYSSPWPDASTEVLTQGLRCITGADLRWGRCDIKSVALLANVMLRQLAVEAQASEIILLADGHLREGSASTVHVVVGGTLVTPPNSTHLLPGTTRIVVEALADQLKLPRRDAAITERQLRAADEIWLSAATREVQPVTILDGQPVGQGRPGPWWQKVHAAFQTFKRDQTA